MTAAKE